MLRALFASLLAGGLALALPTGAAADELTGTLKKVWATKSLVIGYRESSFPFSYLAPGRTKIGTAGEPCEEIAPRRDDRPEPACVLGYSITLCREIADEIAEELGGGPIRVQYRPVTPENRIPLLRAGEIDLECGSTTNSHTRRREVAFSPVIFVTGTKLLVRRAQPIRTHLDLRDRTIVVTAGTSNEAAIRKLNEKQKLDWKIITAPDHEASFQRFMAGEADAFATDDILLAGLVARHQAGRELAVVGEFLSYDPYGIMYRKDDPQLAEVVERTFARLAETRQLARIYNRWFLGQLPTGERLNRPMTPQLEEIFYTLGLPED